MSVGLQGGQSRPDRPSSSSGDVADWNVLKEDVGEIAEVAVERGRHVFDTLREQLESYADHRKDEVAQSFSELARSLRQATEPFDDRPGIRALVDTAAGGLEQVSDAIRSRSAAELYEDLEDAMRRRPGTFALASSAIGFALARFIKASEQRSRQVRRGQGGRRGAVPAQSTRAPAALPQS